MNSVIMSINPQHVEKIFKGIKKYEYRKVLMKHSNLKRVYIYCTAPISKIVGEAIISNVIKDAPDIVWQSTKEYSGISQEFYNEYFMDKEYAIAYRLEKVKSYHVPKMLDEFGVKCAPQSYVYIEDGT